MQCNVTIKLAQPSEPRSENMKQSMKFFFLSEVFVHKYNSEIIILGATEITLQTYNKLSKKIFTVILKI